MSGGGGGEGGKLPSVDHNPLNEGGRDKNKDNAIVWTKTNYYKGKVSFSSSSELGQTLISKQNQRAKAPLVMTDIIFNMIIYLCKYTSTLISYTQSTLLVVTSS